MPATAARIGFITTDLRRAIAGPSTTVINKYGELARDTIEPLPTFFDSVADAQTIADQRMTLLSADRRRFVMEAAQPDVGLALSYQSVLPSVQVIDTELKADFTGIVSEIEIDLEKDTTTLMIWG